MLILNDPTSKIIDYFKTQDDSHAEEGEKIAVFPQMQRLFFNRYQASSIFPFQRYKTPQVRNNFICFSIVRFLYPAKLRVSAITSYFSWIHFASAFSEMHVDRLTFASLGCFLTQYKILCSPDKRLLYPSLILLFSWLQSLQLHSWHQIIFLGQLDPLEHFKLDDYHMIKFLKLLTVPQTVIEGRLSFLRWCCSLPLACQQLEPFGTDRARIFNAAATNFKFAFKQSIALAHNLNQDTLNVRTNESHQSIPQRKASLEQIKPWRTHRKAVGRTGKATKATENSD